VIGEIGFEPDVMRIIGGQYKGRRLKAPEGLSLRPTSDRLRETFFNVVAGRVEDSHFLDLCAGSGAIGIEALSRGAAQVTFIDQSRRAHQVISDNLAHCGITSDVKLVNRDALTALKYYAAHGLQFDLIYFDPPYDSGIYSPVMFLLGTRGLVTPGGLVVAEHRRKDNLATDYGELQRSRVLNQGDSALSFYK